MGEIREFEMTEADLKRLLDVMTPMPMIAIHIPIHEGPQERANRAWAELGSRMGFVPMTATPIPAKGDRFFMAEACEPTVKPVEIVPPTCEELCEEV